MVKIKSVNQAHQYCHSVLNILCVTSFMTSSSVCGMRQIRYTMSALPLTLVHLCKLLNHTSFGRNFV